MKRKLATFGDALAMAVTATMGAGPAQAATVHRAGAVTPAIATPPIIQVIQTIYGLYK